ncbi:MAG: hypothetical protein VX259_02265, partial [Pseudomonadota bacterium]|nr:hypothetical protein [Pseudomonadota bacterium]
SIEAIPDAEDLMAQVDRELDGVLPGLGDLSQASVTLTWAGESDARAQMIERILSVGPAELHLDESGVVKQLHPGIVRSYVEVLGQRESGDLPMIMLGIDTDEAEAAMSALSGMSALIDGRRVLVVYRTEGREVAGSDDNAVVQATRAMLDGSGKAVLQFRPRTRDRAAHFEVVKSDVEGLEVGSRTKDPRG